MYSFTKKLLLIINFGLLLSGKKLKISVIKLLHFKTYCSLYAAYKII